MTWNELKKYNIEDIVVYINEKILEMGSLKAIADILNVNESTIRKRLNSNGYKRINNEFVLKDDMCNQVCNTHEGINEVKVNENSNTNVFNNEFFKKNMFFLNGEIDILKKIIEDYKSRDDKGNIDVIELREGIKIELPDSDIKRTTIRINEKVWNMFNEFVTENKTFDKHDLMGQALLDYMNKYKSK